MIGDKMLEMNLDILNQLEKRAWNTINILILVNSLLIVGYTEIESSTFKTIISLSGLLYTFFMGVIALLFKKRYKALFQDFKDKYENKNYFNNVLKNFFIDKRYCYEEIIQITFFMLWVGALLLWLMILIHLWN